MQSWFPLPCGIHELGSRAVGSQSPLKLRMAPLSRRQVRKHLQRAARERALHPAPSITKIEHESLQQLGS
eukprot:12657236-Alexandrium_andersonii.AAC.1